MYMWLHEFLSTVHAGACGGQRKLDSSRTGVRGSYEPPTQRGFWKLNPGRAYILNP